jgi:glycine hydroxymethyltransferase
MSKYADRFFGADVADVDPRLETLIQLEEERQRRRIILIPSESYAPQPVRQALGSVFTNVYAEGYPPRQMMGNDEELLIDLAQQLTYYRRYADRRFYKGADYVHLIETLAQRRAADCFANEHAAASEIYVNVQPLSGAVANLAVYDALLQPGDTLMGMDLFQGGHLTHGSQFNVSGRRYTVVSYKVTRDGRLDYDDIRALAEATCPKVIIAGYTSYPWAPDFSRFREIADAVGAYLMADIAHPAGMVIAGQYPNPVGIADVVTFTTHKTLCGPRGACILTTDPDLARRIDAAVFPGLQGGPHTNKFAAMCVAFEIARSEAFADLQRGIVENAQALASGLAQRDLKLAYGGTNTHLLLVDLKSARGGVHQGRKERETLYGEVVARILELAGIVVNKQTIPGDVATALATGIRLGTPWVTQRGMGPEEMDRLADYIARIVHGITPFTYEGMRGPLPRGKIDLDTLEEIKWAVDELACEAPAEIESGGSSYPHYCLHPRQAEAQILSDVSDGAANHAPWGVLLVSGWRAQPLLDDVCTADVAAIKPGHGARSLILDEEGRVLDAVAAWRLERDSRGRDRYLLITDSSNTDRVVSWLRGLSDGYVLFDDEDVWRKVRGPAKVEVLGDQVRGVEQAPELALPDQEEQAVLRQALASVQDEELALYESGVFVRDAEVYLDRLPHLFDVRKSYFVGQSILPGLGAVHPDAAHQSVAARRVFSWTESTNAPLKRTPLYKEHQALGAKMIAFAGWEMPVWYSSVGEEHQAVRERAGLFDVGHMGTIEVSGPHAVDLLDLVSVNYVGWLKDGESQYSGLLDADGKILDDIMVYRRAWDRYLVVVNAVNSEKDWAWLNAVNDNEVVIDRQRPWVGVLHPATLRNLKDSDSGPDQRIDIALQGPASRRILLACADGPAFRRELARLERTQFAEGVLDGIDLIVSRTGYTGEEVGYELYVHPDQAVALWRLLLDRGKPDGIQPCGLAARDSTRIEAGLPLYGHELAGRLDISQTEAGFGGYVRYHKPFFIGRTPYKAYNDQSERRIARFQTSERGSRALRGGEPVVNKRGRVIGRVTSCALVGDRQIGMALVESRYAEPETELYLYPETRQAVSKAPPAFEPGDTVALPVLAKVVARFAAKS